MSFMACPTSFRVVSREVHTTLQLPRLCMLAVGRERGESTVLHRATDREVIERLKLQVAETEHLVHRVVEEAADARGSDAGGLGLEVQHLPEHPGFPEERKGRVIRTARATFAVLDLV